MSYIVRASGSPVVLSLTLTKSAVPVTGLSPRIEVRRHSDEFYLDFSATASPFWVASGGQRERTLPEASWQSGFYFWTFDHGAYEPADTEDEYTVVYRVDPPFRFLATETLGFTRQLLGSDLEKLRQMAFNEQDLVEHTNAHFEHKVYDDSGASGGVLVHHADIKRDGNVEKRRIIP